jgi:hypothetical protein
MNSSFFEAVFCLNQMSMEIVGRGSSEHFGISIPYARTEPPAAAVEAVRQRRADRDLSQILPVGRQALVALLGAHLEGGISKFVLRSLSDSQDWRADLDWLADIVLPLQT